MPVDDVDTRPAPARSLTRRERLRRRTVDEIVERALDLVDGGGAHGLSIAQVSKAMGMTPPALYHYFPSRDALLDALVLAAYTDLGAAVEAAAEAASDRPAPDRVAVIAHAWRRWAVDYPRRYVMLFTGSRREAVDPLADVGPIRHSMLALVTALQELVPDGGGGASRDDAGRVDSSADEAAAPARGAATTGGGTSRGAAPADENEAIVEPGLDADLLRWGQSLGAPPETAPDALRLALSTWYRVHGLVSLELVGGFGTMGLDGAALLTAEIESLVRESAR
ncbi:TetR/AcrR family transcriptional regulator [Promicromonospora sukumoe]|uniref:AcrR family transcriptional regulator n=1 Tax=Promicromonospora sukumoe TaxID=88382 RepID=A0A7W3J8C3_9MICO|nr:TetR/AcrR family transcriptional regulator [Promicromonospora sukumoe]MBA8808150.1 AcrR family transcriptional regulator [Promicromonospora sukumoe]